MMNPFPSARAADNPRIKLLAALIATAVLGGWVYFLVNGGLEFQEPSVERERCRSMGGVWSEGYYGGRPVGLCGHPPGH